MGTRRVLQCKYSNHFIAETNVESAMSIISLKNTSRWTARIYFPLWILIQCGTEYYGSHWSKDNEHKVAGQPSTNVIVFTLQIGYNSSIGLICWQTGKLNMVTFAAQIFSLSALFRAHLFAQTSFMICLLAPNMTRNNFD